MVSAESSISFSKLQFYLKNGLEMDEFALSSLPESIIFEILSHLPVRERCIAGRVCKRWRQIIASDSLWRHVNLLEYRLNVPKMWKIMRAHFTSSLLSLRICGYDNDTNLVTNAFLKALQTKCPNINTLHLHDCRMDKLSLDCVPPTLTTLSITKSAWQRGFFHWRGSRLANLTSLNLSHCVRFDTFELIEVAQWTDLRKLILSGCFRLNNVSDIASRWKALEVLDLSKTEAGDPIIHSVAQHCSNIRELYLQHCPKMKDSWLAEISSGLKNLEVLDVSMRECFTMEGLEVLWSLKKLRLLYFSGTNFEAEDEELLRNGFVQRVQVNHLTISQA